MQLHSSRVGMTAALVGAAVTVFAAAVLDHLAALWTAQGIYADEHQTGGETPGVQLWGAAGCVCLLIAGLVVGVAGGLSWVGHRRAEP